MRLGRKRVFIVGIMGVIKGVTSTAVVKERERGRIALLVIGLAIFTLVPAVPAAAVTATVSGTVFCNSGRSVTGVWIHSSAGGAGWASFTRLPKWSSIAYYSRSVTFPTTSSTVSLTVGCGGSPASWASSNRTSGFGVSSSYVLNVRCADPTSGSGTCSGERHPGGRSSNTFAGGYCTWGAAELWKKATGQYPLWDGNAHQWDEKAGALGFRRSVIPQQNSLVVFEATSSNRDGHVAWVTRTWISGSDIWFNIREMNRSGLWTWSNRDVKLGSNMSFVVPRPARWVTS